MDGNVCVTCKKQTTEDKYYDCDLCMQKTHKTCASLSASEVKCMPLQKRILVLLCNDCKVFLSKAPMMTTLLEQMNTELIGLKNEVGELRSELRDGNNSQPALISRSYSQALAVNTNNHPKTHVKIQAPSIIIKPKHKQSSGKTAQALREKIQPNKLKIGIKQVKETKQGNVIVKCTEGEDIKKLKQAAIECLSNEYDIEDPKLNLPRMKIIGYNGNESKEELENSIRQQNKWIEDSETLQITYIKITNKENANTIFFECSPALYWKLMDTKKLFVGWQSCLVYENLSVTRCFKCQGYRHRGRDCPNNIACEFCAGEHEKDNCPKQAKLCKNCVNANSEYKLNHDVVHTAADPECPSTKFQIDLLRSKTDYSVA